jgi:hypothetical protein
VAPVDPDQPEDRDELLAYLRQAYEDLDMSPPEQMLFDAHMIGALSWHVAEDDWRGVIDSAARWTRKHREKRP